MRNFSCLLIPLILIMATPAAADDLQAIVDECEACHGPGGLSDHDDIPSIGGRPAADIEESINQFYFYERHCPTTTYRYGDKPKSPMNMCDVAGRLSKPEVKAIGQYFETGEFPAAGQDTG